MLSNTKGFLSLNSSTFSDGSKRKKNWVQFWFHERLVQTSHHNIVFSSFEQRTTNVAATGPKEVSYSEISGFHFMNCQKLNKLSNNESGVKEVIIFGKWLRYRPSEWSSVLCKNGKILRTPPKIVRTKNKQRNKKWCKIRRCRRYERHRQKIFTAHGFHLIRLDDLSETMMKVEGFLAAFVNVMRLSTELGC